jgi:dolichol-phosphate mannosyltransferase
LEMKTYGKKIVIIPSCKNTAQLLNVLASFRNVPVNEICIVIDQATNGDLQKIEATTQKIALPTSIISRPDRKGVGNAIREGITYAIDKNYDIAIVMAANGKDQPCEIPRLLAPIIVRGFDYVQGSRFLPGGKPVKTPFLRGIFAKLYPYFWTLITSKRCTDVTNGFRAYRLSVFKDPNINLNQNWLDGYQLEYYLHYKVLTLGYRVKEVPVSKVYPFRNKGGYSNISPLRDWWKIVGPLIYLKLGIKK